MTSTLREHTTSLKVDARQNGGGRKTSARQPKTRLQSLKHTSEDFKVTLELHKQIKRRRCQRCLKGTGRGGGGKKKKHFHGGNCNSYKPFDDKSKRYQKQHFPHKPSDGRFNYCRCNLKLLVFPNSPQDALGRFITEASGAGQPPHQGVNKA